MRHFNIKLICLLISCGVGAFSLGALSPNQIEGNQAVLDWNEYDLSAFPALPDGSKFTEITTVGDYPATGELSLGEVVPENTTIGQVEGLNDIKLGDIAESVPGLADRKVGESPALLKVVENYAVSKGMQIGERYASKYADKYIGKLFKDIPALKDLPIGQFSDLLSRDPLSAIPGLAETALNKIPGMDKVGLDKIPGMDKVPLNKILDLVKYSPVALLDQVYSKEESRSLFKPISGSHEAGWHVPCNQAHCQYIELEDFKGSLKGVLKPADLLSSHGARWIVGGPNKANGEQMVEGGSGKLGKLFGGLEPTGRPLGDNFKIVATKVNQPKGSVNFSLFTQACTKFSGCTPRIIGPIPLFEFKEKDLVFLGTPDYKMNKSKMPKWAQDKISKIVNKFEPLLDAAGGLDGMGGDGGGNPEDCAQKVLAKVDPSLLSRASSFVPALVNDALKTGFSANQTAFFVAVAEDKYSFNANPSALVSQFKAIAKTHITDKAVDFYTASSAAGLSGGTAQKAAAYQSALKPCQNSSCSASGRMIRPSAGPLVSSFGMRLSPTLGVWRLHAGADLGDGIGEPIRAADCGTVEYVGWEDGYGQVVIVKHGRYFTRSAHTSAQLVRVGQRVAQGQTIARAGATGRVTGPHLHWEVRDGGAFGTPLNPALFVNLN